MTDCINDTEILKHINAAGGHFNLHNKRRPFYYFGELTVAKLTQVLYVRRHGDGYLFISNLFCFVFWRKFYIFLHFPQWIVCNVQTRVCRFEKILLSPLTSSVRETESNQFHVWKQLQALRVDSLFPMYGIKESTLFAIGSQLAFTENLQCQLPS